MAFSNLIAVSIMITTAAAPHSKGLTKIETSAQAAGALKPIAGEFASLSFAMGIIGTGLLAVRSSPVPPPMPSQRAGGGQSD